MKSKTKRNSIINVELGDIARCDTCKKMKRITQTLRYRDGKIEKYCSDECFRNYLGRGQFLH